jgi:ribosomal protein S18 acetylase RimI-like enzyme
MEIRKANKKDAEGIAKVLIESYNIDSVEEGKEAFLREVSVGMNFVVAVNDDEVVGLTSWVMHGVPKHGLIELDRIAVLPSFKGKGVAQDLFSALVDQADLMLQKNGGKIRKLYILCHASNARAHQFYAKMGMKHETTLKDHYYKGEDEFVFSRFF